MKRLLRAVVLLLASVASAAAADMGVPAPTYTKAPPLPVANWTGWYVGLNAGGTFGGNGSTAITTAPGFVAPGFFASTPTGFAAATTANGTFGSSRNGFIGGGQIGWNFQFSTSFVAGIEADIQGTTAKSSGSVVSTLFVPQVPGTVSSTMSGSSRLDYLGTLRGRLGFVAAPSVLLYGTGGLAYGGASASGSVLGALNPPGFVAPFSNTWGTSANSSATRAGWTAGAGGEWRVAQDWSAKLEYLYYDLGSMSTSLGTLNNAGVGAPLTLFSHSPLATTRFNGNIIRTGVNYHFN